MKRSILFMLALTLIGSSALAQQSAPSAPAIGASIPGSSSPTGGAGGGSPAGNATFGTSSGVQNINDPAGIGAAASKFGH